MKLFSTLTTLIFATVAAAQQPSWTDCAPGPTDMNVVAFSVSPYPLCINQNMCINAAGVLNTPIIMPAKLAITGKYLGRIVYTDNQDFCAVLASVGMSCPAPVTITSISLCVLVKPSCPANILFHMTIQATNGNSHVLFCQTGVVTATNCV